MTFTGCAVIRYYGGKKLGVPGLIEAYGQTATLALQQAKIKTLVLRDTLVCTISPIKSYILYNLLQRHTSAQYTTENDQFIITVPKSMTLELLTELKNIDTLAVIDEI